MHGLIYLTEDNRKNLDEGNIGCGIFVDLQKAFDNVEHDILLAKLEDHGIRGLVNEWFRINKYHVYFLTSLEHLKG